MLHFASASSPRSLLGLCPLSPLEDFRSHTSWVVGHLWTYCCICCNGLQTQQQTIEAGAQTHKFLFRMEPSLGLNTSITATTMRDPFLHRLRERCAWSTYLSENLSPPLFVANLRLLWIMRTGRVGRAYNLTVVLIYWVLYVNRNKTRQFFKY